MIAALESSGGLVRRPDHPRLHRMFDRMLESGELRAVLPGIYVSGRTSPSRGILAAAAMLWAPNTVICGRCAASLEFWPEIAAGTIEVAGCYRRVDRGSYRLTRRTVPSDLVLERAQGGQLPPIRLTAPALTALDRVPELGAEPIDRLLRSRQVRIRDLRQALVATRKRRGNLERARLLMESRSEPWSAAEREAHRILRTARITDWHAKALVRVSGRSYFLDIAFRSIKLAVEIDGRFHQDDRDQFQTDRSRQNDLVLPGWMVLRFTWADLTRRPDQVVAQIRAAIGQCTKRVDGKDRSPGSAGCSRPSCGEFCSLDAEFCVRIGPIGRRGESFYRR